MKIFGSISELVDLAFRLAGGKQVKLKSLTQTNTTGGNLITINVPDVVETGVTQNMVLTAATQSLSNKTLSSPTISGGTINNSIIGGSTPAAGTFTAVTSGSLSTNGSTTTNSLVITPMNSPGVLHNDALGAITSSQIVNADVSASAAIAFSKLASLASAEILVGSGAGVATARAMSGDVTIDNLGATSIGASKVTDGMLAGNITRTKLATGNNYRILANNSSGQMSENAALTPSEAVATDANGQLVTVTGVSATELGYLSNVTSDIQTQISAKANSGANSDITSLSGLTTALSGAQGGTGVANTGKTITLGGNLVTSGNFTTTLTATNTTNVTLPTSGTLATTSNKLSAFAATSSSELAGVISDETGSGSLVFGTNPTLATPTLNGHKYGVSGSLTVSSNTLTPTADRSIQVIGTGATLQMIDNPADGQEFILINASGSDFTIANNTGATAANRIYTGTGADYTFKANSSVSVVYNSTLSRWVLAGGGGAGGLSTSYITAGGITAVANTHYLTNLSASGQTITLPAGTNGSVIRFSDAGEKWDVYPLTIAPATGEKIDNLATNETLVCDVKRGWVELSYNSTFGGWALMSLASTSGSAAGSGEVNAILNPTAASGTTGWTNVTQVSSGSPLDPIVSSAFSISNAATSETYQSGGYYSISSMPSSLRSKKLKVSFYFSTPATDVYKVSVYAGSTRLALSSDAASPTLTVLPANVTGGYFEAYFDSTTASAYSLNITRTSGSTGACVITQVIVGPGSNAQGAAISEWQTYTPSSSAGAALTYNGRYKREGSDILLKIGLRYASALPAGVLSFSFAQLLNGLGLTVDTSKIPGYGTSAGTNYVFPLGIFSYADAGVNTYNGTATYLADLGILALYVDGPTVNQFVTNTAPVTMGTNDNIMIDLRLPIAEWAGNGTVNLGAGAQVEYASTSGTWDADSSTTIYGPAGAALGGTLSTSRSKTVTWQYPVQSDDQIVVEASRDGIYWAPINGYRFASVTVIPSVDSAAAEVSGVSWHQISATQTIVSFGRYANIANDDAPVSNWPSSGAFWRVRKAKASAPVGFGLADSNNSGLIKATSTLGLMRYNTQNGYGSTNTTIRRFSTLVSSNSDVTYADTAAAATSFTITVSGVYTINYSDAFSTAATMGLSVNSSQLTTSIANITAANRLIAISTPAAHFIGQVSYTGYFSAGDVIRPHTDGTASSGSTAAVMSTFTIQRLC